MLAGLRARLHRPSPAMLVALTALFVALGGTSYAAIKLPANSVGSKQIKRNAVSSVKIKRNAVTGSKVRDGSLTGADFASGTLLKGDRGPAGPSGAAGTAGATGAPGAAGRSALTALQSGETIRGLVGARYENGGTAVLPYSSVASSPIPASTPLDNAHVVVDGTPDEPANECTGSTTNVTAPAGFVCIYPDIVNNATFAADAGETGVAGTRTLGFQLDWSST